SPGFEGLEEATGVDIAGAIVEHALALAQAAPVGARRRRVI
ncbi:MAG TPA: 30S ribosomal protein S6--L-glutamate ligase, partial [Myxococcaceae bacterium]|nr:30S ribosomal protein S6--L-glutamate ligase [Myxococcaceae bacterium]